jgi:hypothetical protein
MLQLNCFGSRCFWQFADFQLMLDYAIQRSSPISERFLSPSLNEQLVDQRGGGILEMFGKRRHVRNQLGFSYASGGEYPIAHRLDE